MERRPRMTLAGYAAAMSANMTRRGEPPAAAARGPGAPTRVT